MNGVEGFSEEAMGGGEIGCGQSDRCLFENLSQVLSAPRAEAPLFNIKCIVVPLRLAVYES